MSTSNIAAGGNGQHPPRYPFMGSAIRNWKQTREDLATGILFHLGHPEKGTALAKRMKPVGLLEGRPLQGCTNHLAVSLFLDLRQEEVTELLVLGGQKESSVMELMAVRIIAELGIPRTPMH